MRCLILNRNSAFAKGASRGDIAGSNPARGSKELAGGKINSILSQFRCRCNVCETDRGIWSLLVVAANLLCISQPELSYPTFYEP